MDFISSQICQFQVTKKIVLHPLVIVMVNGSEDHPLKFTKAQTLTAHIPDKHSTDLCYKYFFYEENETD